MSHFIAEVKIYINSSGKYRASDHVGEKMNYPCETRYCVCNHSGPIMEPECLYKTPMASHCAGASPWLKPTRRYKEPLDKTYFKYYDDAEEVLHNIERFITWLKNQTGKKIVKGWWMSLTKEHPDTLDAASMRASKIGSPKKRSELTGLLKDMAECDLLER